MHDEDNVTNLEGEGGNIKGWHARSIYECTMKMQDRDCLRILAADLQCEVYEGWSTDFALTV